MSELIQVKGDTYLIPGSAYIGVIKNGDGCVLVDTGLEAAVAKRILKTLDANALAPRAIINTHSHADHCGGNRHIQKTTGCMAYASQYEGAIILNPDIEALYLTGAVPPKPLRSKLIVSEQTLYMTFLEPGKHIIEGVEIELIPLPGHSPGQYGVRTADNVLFYGDSLVPAYVFDKYKIPFVTDIDATLASIDRIEASGANAYVGAHEGVVDDIGALCKANREGILRGREIVYELLEAPMLREAVLQRLHQTYPSIPISPVGWSLMLTCVSACLYSLHKEGRVELIIDGGAMLWGAK